MSTGSRRSCRSRPWPETGGAMRELERQGLERGMTVRARTRRVSRPGRARPSDVGARLGHRPAAPVPLSLSARRRRRREDARSRPGRLDIRESGSPELVCARPMPPDASRRTRDDADTRVCDGRSDTTGRAREDGPTAWQSAPGVSDEHRPRMREHTEENDEPRHFRRSEERVRARRLDRAREPGSDRHARWRRSGVSTARTRKVVPVSRRMAQSS